MAPSEPTPLAPAVDVAVVSYRCRDLLRSCLESVEAVTLPVAVHVVDNASGDGTAEMVGARFPDVRLTLNESNAGFAAATNVAIRAGTAPYVLALNPDARLEDGTLEALVGLMEARPEVGICGCRLVRPDGRLDHAARRSFPTVLGALGHFTGVGRRDDAPRRLAQYRAPEVASGPVDAVNGAFMLIRRAALEQVGLFDEGYWMYMEDLDLCYRFGRAGWTTWYEPSVAVEHVKGGTVGAARDLRLQVAFHRGMARFYRAHYASGRPRSLNGAVYAGIAAKLVLAAPEGAIRRLVAGELGPVRFRRARFSATPRYARLVELRRAVGRTRVGEAVKRRRAGGVAV